MAELDTAKFEEFISAYPIYEYRILDTSDLCCKNKSTSDLQTGM